MTKVVIDPEVYFQVRGFQRYIVHHFQNRKAASKIPKLINNQIRILHKFPTTGNFITNVYNNIRPTFKNYRRMIVKHYVILYLYDSRNDTCYVDFIFDDLTNYLSKISE